MFGLMKILLTALPIVVLTFEKDLWESFKQQDGRIINKTNLINQYKELYPILYGRGAKLLPKTIMSGEIFSQVFCSDIVSCHCEGTCCVESALSYLKTIYIGTEVYPLPNHGKMYLLVNECPYDYTDKVKQKCTETGFLPVTSAYTGISYKNRFCARCHNENEVVEWRLGLTCPNRTQTHSKDLSNCTIQLFLEDHNLLAHGCLLYTEMNLEQTISSCNETGMWSNYDGDIDWACRRFPQPFNHFRNLFCYICNPFTANEAQTTKIDTCSYKTAQLSSEDDFGIPNRSDIVETMCKTAATIPRLSPFKNAFCYVCNEPIKIETYPDIGKIEIIQKLQKQLLFKITLNTYDETLTAELFKSKLAHLLNELLNQTKNLTVNRENIELEIGKETKKTYSISDKILEIFENVCSKDTLCTRATPGTNNTRMRLPCDSCSCHQNCLIQKFRQCCFDKLVDFKSIGCFNESMFSFIRSGSAKTFTSGIHTFKLVDQCLDYSSNDSDTENCLDDDISDIWKGIPVHSPAQDLLPFKNIFCLLCNKDIQTYDVDVYLKVVCSNMVDLDIFTRLSDFFESIQYKDCRIFFTIDEFVQVKEQCELDGEYIEATNKEFVCFGKPRLKGKGKDIRKLCKELDNIPHIVKDLSQMQYYSYSDNKDFKNFKNAFRISTVVQCREKNTFLLSSEHFCFFRFESFENARTESKLVVNQRLNYRTLFAVSRSDLQRFQLLNDASVCELGILDTANGICRDVFCDDGRLLQSGSCVHVFESVHDTAFLVSLFLRPCDIYQNKHKPDKTNQSCCVSPTLSVLQDVFLSPADVCGKMNKTIRKMLSDETEIQYIQCHFRMYSCGQNNCKGNWFDEQLNNTWIVSKNSVIHANITVHVDFSENRSNIEIQLSKFAKHKVFRETGVGLCSVTNYDIQCEDFCDEHFISMGYIPDHNTLENVVVIKSTLFCPVVEITVSHLRISQTAGTVFFIFSGKEFSFSVLDVDILKDGKTKWKIRMCEINIEQLLLLARNIQPKKVDNVYFLFSTICNILSLMSLLLTLLTYIIFKELRTLPGRNNMSLAFCLLLAQSSLQYSYISPGFRSERHCQILGMFIHYFWFGTFCALNVCSFHMYRVFSERFMSRSDQEMSFIRMYTVYIYGFPAFIVSAVAIGNMVIRDKIGYGEIRCFIDEFYSLVISFLTPSCLIFVTNAIFYGITFYNIRSSPTLRRNTEERNTFGIYVKLCTITGIAWPLLFIDALFPLSFVSYLITFINAMQGFFIFLSFICNRRVFNLYKGYVSSHRQRDTAVSGMGTYSWTRSVQRH